jgi:hypothetical protein
MRRQRREGRLRRRWELGRLEAASPWSSKGRLPTSPSVALELRPYLVAD